MLQLAQTPNIIMDTIPGEKFNTTKFIINGYN